MAKNIGNTVDAVKIGCHAGSFCCLNLESKEKKLHSIIHVIKHTWSFEHALNLISLLFSLVINDHLSNHSNNQSFNRVIIHVGWNDLRSSQDSETIAKNIIDVTKTSTTNNKSSIKHSSPTWKSERQWASGK